MVEDGIGRAARAMLAGAGYKRRGVGHWVKPGSDRFSLMCKLQTKKRFAGVATMTVDMFVLSPAYGAFMARVPPEEYDEPGLPLLSFCLYPPPEASFAAAGLADPPGASKIFYNAPEWLWDSDPESTIGAALLSHLHETLAFCDKLNSAGGLSDFYSSGKKDNPREPPKGGLRPVSFFIPDFVYSMIRIQGGNLEEALRCIERAQSEHSDVEVLKQEVISWVGSLKGLSL